MREHRDTIAALTGPGRGDLTSEEKLALDEAQQAVLGHPDHTECIDRDGWSITLGCCLLSPESWYVIVSPVPNPSFSRVNLAGLVSEAVARAVADAFLTTPGSRRKRTDAARAVRRAMAGF